MRPLSGICYRSFPLFLRRFVGEGFASRVLAVPEGLGGAVGEADHVVLPVGIVYPSGYAIWNK